MHNLTRSSPDAARLLIIRFSSFGDIVQAVGVPTAFRKNYPGAEVDWLVRADFSSLVEDHPEIRKVHSFSRDSGLVGLMRLAWQLAAGGGYTHLYDAHNNLRSNVFCLVYRLRRPLVNFARRPKNRWRRWLFFRFRLPVLQMPFRGANSFHEPLKPWGLAPAVPIGRQFYSNADLPGEVERELQSLSGPIIALAPSAAWQMKRWPIENWKALVQLLPEMRFVCLGGPEDRFINDISLVAPERCLNLAGRLKLNQNAAIFAQADLVIANDTGLLHVADQMERPTIALIGPTAFGYPSHPSSRELEIDLSCKPCSKDGRGQCVNSVYQRCLVELSPERVAQTARELLARNY